MLIVLLLMVIVNYFGCDLSEAAKNAKMLIITLTSIGKFLLHLDEYLNNVMSDLVNLNQRTLNKIYIYISG